MAILLGELRELYECVRVVGVHQIVQKSCLYVAGYSARAEKSGALSISVYVCRDRRDIHVMDSMGPCNVGRVYIEG